jgi:hypothetical protein
MTERPLKADLHVHSWHSTENGDLPFLKSRDCYSDPVDVYRTAKARGMDIVTITDHDSINGCLELLSRMPDVDDFVIGEEVSCRIPEGDIEVHLGVYGMTEALHLDIQPLRRNAFDVIARLREAQVFFSLNHLLHFYRRQVPLDTYLRIVAEVPALEVRNGTMVPAHNVLVERLLAHLRHSSTGPGGRWPAVTAGSDAHTLRRVGRIPGFTEEGPRAAVRYPRRHTRRRGRRVRGRGAILREPLRAVAVESHAAASCGVHRVLGRLAAGAVPALDDPGLRQTA